MVNAPESFSSCLPCDHSKHSKTTLIHSHTHTCTPTTPFSQYNTFSTSVDPHTKKCGVLWSMVV